MSACRWLSERSRKSFSSCHGGYYNWHGDKHSFEINFLNGSKQLRWSAGTDHLACGMFAKGHKGDVYWGYERIGRDVWQCNWWAPGPPKQFFTIDVYSESSPNLPLNTMIRVLKSAYRAG
jgi:hypothetical protein